jgi:hypothetical protein
MHFALAQQEQARCPIFLNGLIHEEFTEDGFDRPMRYDWHYPVGTAALADLPAELWLISKNRAYDFDFRSQFGGHIVSADFLELMRYMETGGWQAAKLHAVSTKGRRISAKDYYFVKFPRAELLRTEEVVDFDGSRIDYRRDGQIKKVWELRFKRPPQRDLFLLDCIPLLDVVFCSARFAEAAGRLGPKGVDFVELPALGRAG